MSDAEYSFSTIEQSDLIRNYENECSYSNNVCFQLPREEYTNLVFMIRSLSNINHTVSVAIFDESVNEWVHSQDLPIKANNDEWIYYADWVNTSPNVNMLKIYTDADSSIDIKNGFIFYNYSGCSSINNEEDCINEGCYWCDDICQDEPCENGNGEEDNTLIHMILIAGGLGAGILGYYLYKKKHKT